MQPKHILGSYSAGSRQYLRQQGLVVARQGRDLGGHVAYCKQHTNSTITERRTSLHPFWSVLLRSPACVTHKQSPSMCLAKGPSWSKNNSLRSSIFRSFAHMPLEV